MALFLDKKKKRKDEEWRKKNTKNKTDVDVLCPAISLAYTDDEFFDRRVIRFAYLSLSYLKISLCLSIAFVIECVSVANTFKGSGRMAVHSMLFIFAF